MSGGVLVPEVLVRKFGMYVVYRMDLLPRLVICVKDIQYMLGCSERTAQRKLQAIRRQLGKEVYQPVSVKEYCRCMQLSEEEVREYVRR